MTEENKNTARPRTRLQRAQTLKKTRLWKLPQSVQELSPWKPWKIPKFFLKAFRLPSEYWEHMSYKTGPICFACQNEQEPCANCRESDYRPLIHENFEHEGAPYRFRADIEDDECTKHRLFETELALAAISRLQAISAQRRGAEEAKKRKEEEKARKAEAERLLKERQNALYREKLYFPANPHAFDFESAAQKTWTNPPKVPSPFDGLSSGVEEIKDFRITSSLYPQHAWVVKARTEYTARLQVARYLKISFSETQIA